LLWGLSANWVLDFVTHRPDMPLYPGGPRRARDRTGRYSLLAFLAVSLVIYLGAIFGSPPPNTHVLMVSAFVGWVVPFWAWGFDRHREIVALGHA
jgi:hypothetical protein